MGVVATGAKLGLSQKTATGEAQHTFVEVQQRGMSSGPYAGFQRGGTRRSRTKQAGNRTATDANEVYQGGRSYGFESGLAGALCSKKNPRKKDKMQNAE